MNYFSQKDPRWANEKLGTSDTTIGSSGCKITTLGNLINKTPEEINQIMLEKNAYVKGCLSEDKSTADALGLAYAGKTTNRPSGICIAETDHFKNHGVKQHFFLLSGEEIVDPLDKNPGWKKNTYNIVSYRLFAVKEAEKTNVFEENILLLKKLWPLQNDENKILIGQMATKNRDAQNALGLKITK